MQSILNIQSMQSILNIQSIQSISIIICCIIIGVIIKRLYFNQIKSNKKEQIDILSYKIKKNQYQFKIKKNQYQFKIKKNEYKKIDIEHAIIIINQILIEIYEKNKTIQNSKIDLLLENRKITLNDCNHYYTICRSDMLAILNIIIENKK